jgi:CSLREA domain-containing protein
MMGMVQEHQRNGQVRRTRIGWRSGSLALSLVLAGIALAAAPTGHALAAGNYVVNSNNDQSDENPGNNICKIAGSNQCTLRAAIQEANAHSGADNITFNLGTATISLSNDLPEIVDHYTIIRGDGNITLDGGNQNDDLTGLSITSNYNRVQGLRFQNFKIGIRIKDSHDNIVGVDGDGMTDNTTERNVIGDNFIGVVIYKAGMNTVAGNHIGVGPGGNSANPNVFGIDIYSGRGNLIGTNGDGVSDTAERNIISGSTDIPNIEGSGIVVTESSATTIAGNYIGTNQAGDSALPNQNGIKVSYSTYTVIGVGSDKASAAQRNVISASVEAGIMMSESGTIVAGNYIGTSANGNQPLGNGIGIEVLYGYFNRIGTDGNDQGDALERNVISGNGIGVRLQSSDLNIVAGNHIGTRADGTQPLGNDKDGVLVGINANGNQIGINAGGQGSVAERNVISGNGGSGVVLRDNSLNSVGGNYIGTDASGKVAMGNIENGVLIDGAMNSYIGWQTPQFTMAAGNVIAYNGDQGIRVISEKALYNQILGNAIYQNDLLGIALDDDGVTPNDPGDVDEGPNHLANFPVATEVLSDGTQIGIQGKIADGIEGSELIIEFFASKSCDPSGNGEGEIFIGRAFYDLSVIGTDFDFNEVFTKSVEPGMVVTMTATWIENGSDNSTSEFSECIEVKEGKPERKR